MKFWSNKIFVVIIIFNKIGARVFAKWLTYQATQKPSPAHARRNWSILTKLKYMANVILKANFKDEFQLLEEIIICQY